MIRRAVILFLFVMGFVGSVLSLPEAVTMKPSRLGKRLPESLGSWVGTPQEPGPKEKQILAVDTEFERVEYEHAQKTYPPIQASIVFSGKNLSQSIHRPEVCLRAQGWEFASENYFDWTGLLPNGEVLPVKEIICKRIYQYRDAEGEIKNLKLPNGEVAYIWRSFYYCFFGHTKIVAGHYQRTGEDIKDRLFKGYDQRWAYATFSAFISKKHADQGINPRRTIVLDIEQTKQLIGSFLTKLLPQVVSKPGAGSDPSLVEGYFGNDE